MQSMNILASQNKLWDTFITYFTDGDRWVEYALIALKVIMIIVIAKIASKLLKRFIKQIAEAKDRLKFNPRRTTTIMRLMGNIVNYAINFVAIMMILSVFGIPLGPMLAGAGVVGLAIGFGAQSLVKDVITGFFIIFEDQFAVGDVIQTRTFKGTVEEIGLRVTRLKSGTGEIHIIPNGSIVEVTNYSIHNSIAIIDITIPYEASLDKAMIIIQQVMTDINLRNDHILKQPEILGIQSMTASEVVIRVTFECKSNQQGTVARQINAEIKKSFDVNGFEIPYPKHVI